MGTREECVAALHNSHSRMSKQEGQKFQQHLSAIIAALGSAVIGSNLAWTSPAVPMLENFNSTSPLHSTESENSWVASLLPVGAIFGALPGGIIANILGRKVTMIAFSIPWIGCWISILFAKSITTLYIARFVAGIVTGVISAVVPMYVSEIAEVSIRGALGSYFQLFLTIGILYTYTFGALDSYSILTGANVALSILFTLGSMLLPESPMYLLSKNKRTQAEKSLRKLRGPNYDINEEINEIKKALNESSEQKFSFHMLCNKANIKALVISFGLMVFQQLSGINAVIFFSATIFKESGCSLSASLSSILLGVVQCVATFASGFLIDRAGRKPLLLLSNVIMAFTLGVLGYNFLLKEQGHDITTIGWVPLTSLLVFIVVFSLGIGPIPWMMTAEILSPEIKGFASGVAVGLNWIQAFLVTRFFRQVADTIGSSYTFWIFSGICILGIFFISFVVLETKGKTLQQIQKELAGKKEEYSNGKTQNGV